MIWNKFIPIISTNYLGYPGILIRYYDENGVLHNPFDYAYRLEDVIGCNIRYSDHGDYHCLYGPANIRYCPQGIEILREYGINGYRISEEIFKKRIRLVKRFIDKIKDKLRAKKQKTLVHSGFIQDIAFLVSKYVI